MPDNVGMTEGAGRLIATDLIGGVDHQRVKLEFGPDGVAADVHAGNPVPVAGQGRKYKAVPASSTLTTLGATGAAGDDLDFVLIVPATLSPGAVTIKDGTNGAITIFAGGTNSVASLVPFAVPIYSRSTSGAWQVTTGANVSAIGVGNFT